MVVHTPSPGGVRMKIRVTHRVLDWLSGTGAWQRMESAARKPGHTLVDLDAAARTESDGLFWLALFRAPRRKDGSRTVELDRDAALDLREWADYCAVANADEAGPEDTDALAELNAARGLMRQIDRKLATR